MGLADNVVFEKEKKGTPLFDKILGAATGLLIAGAGLALNSAVHKENDDDSIEEFSHSRTMLLENRFEGGYYLYNVTDYLTDLADNPLFNETDNPNFNRSFFDDWLEEKGRFVYGVTLRPKQDLANATTEDFLRGMIRFKRVLNETHDGILVTEGLVYSTPLFEIKQKDFVYDDDFMGILYLEKDPLEERVTVTPLNSFVYTTYDDYLTGNLTKNMDFFVETGEDFDFVVVNPLLGYLRIKDIEVGSDFPLSSSLYYYDKIGPEHLLTTGALLMSIYFLRKHRRKKRRIKL